MNYSTTLDTPVVTGMMDDRSLEAMYGFFGVFFLIFILLVLAVAIFLIVCNWKIYQKAGREGWEAIVPIYNFYVLFEIIGMNPWWCLAFLFTGVPVIGLFVFGLTIYSMVKLAHTFGKSTGYGFGLALLPIVFYPMLAFGTAKYQKPK